MKIENFLSPTFIDYEGKVAAILFVPGCNFRCPYCHAQDIVYGKGALPVEQFLDYIRKKKDWLDGVVVCGGEPTLQTGLCEFIQQLKTFDLAVKLDTNGSNPAVLEKLLERNLIDYIAMDVKAPPDLYHFATGIQADTSAIEASIQIASQFPGYEFRTTVAPFITENDTSSSKMRFMTPPEAIELAQWIVNASGTNLHPYYLQKFVPHEGKLINAALENMSKTPEPLLQEMYEQVKVILPNTQIR